MQYGLLQSVCDSISQMRGLARILIVLVLLAALPLRGYAAVAAELCHDNHGGAGTTHLPVEGIAAVDSGDSGAGSLDHSGFASVCGNCASCCVGASLAPEDCAPFAFAAAGAIAIPFHGSPASGRVPETLDRPPLAL